MGLFGLVFIVVALVLIGVGIAVGLAACAVGVLLLGLGIISSSVFIGVRSGRSSAGVRAFLLQCGILAGLPAGAACAWLAQSFLETYGNDLSVLVYGALGGAFAGVVIALLLGYVWKRGSEWAATRALSLSAQARQDLTNAGRSGSMASAEPSLPTVRRTPGFTTRRV